MICILFVITKPLLLTRWLGESWKNWVEPCFSSVAFFSPHLTLYSLLNTFIFKCQVGWPKLQQSVKWGATQFFHPNFDKWALKQNFPKMTIVELVLYRFFTANILYCVLLCHVAECARGTKYSKFAVKNLLSTNSTIVILGKFCFNEIIQTPYTQVPLWI